MYDRQLPHLDTALVDTVEQGEELILRAQVIAHDAEEKVRALADSMSSGLAIEALAPPVRQD
jgi:hypothetical protein